MNIHYKNRKIEKVCTDCSFAEKKYGTEMMVKINQRISELEAAESIDFMIKFHIGRCHKLIGNRNGEYALDLVHPKRMIFTEVDNMINVVKILEIVDYHR